MAVLVLLVAVPSVTRAQSAQPLNFAPEKGAWPVRFLADDEWVLRGTSRPGAFIDAIGRSAVWMGTEQGILEAWVWPWKIFHQFNLAARTGEVGSEIDLSELARSVEVRPYGTQITYVHSRFQIRQTLFAHAVDPVLVMLLEVDTSTDITLWPPSSPISFRCGRPEWGGSTHISTRAPPVTCWVRAGGR